MYAEIYKELKKKIRKDYGSQCRDFVWGCPVCMQYLMLQFLQDNVDNEKEDNL